MLASTDKAGGTRDWGKQRTGVVGGSGTSRVNVRLAVNLTGKQRRESAKVNMWSEADLFTAGSGDGSCTSCSDTGTVDGSDCIGFKGEFTLWFAFSEVFSCNRFAHDDMPHMDWGSAGGVPVVPAGGVSVCLHVGCRPPNDRCRDANMTATPLM